jgi:hypothetical protein
MTRISLLLLIFLLAGLKSYSKTPIDTLKLQVNQLNTDYQRRTDSLERELQYYKVKEDYFSAAVDRQGTHFEFLLSSLLAIIGFVITIGGFFSLRFIERKINKVQLEWKKNIEHQESINSTILSSTRNLKKELYYQLAFTIAADTKNNEDKYTIEVSLNRYLRSMRNILHSYHSSDCQDSSVETYANYIFDKCIQICETLLEEIRTVDEEERTDKFDNVKKAVIAQRNEFQIEILLIQNSALYNKAIELLVLLNKTTAIISV